MRTVPQDLWHKYNVSNAQGKYTWTLCRQHVRPRKNGLGGNINNLSRIQSGMQETDELHNRERVLTVFGRLRKAGGVPWSETQIKQLAGWFRTLSSRGFTDQGFITDREGVVRTFEKAYANPMTRCQYTRAFLLYLSGLTDEEYKQEYTTVSRADIASLMNDITRRAGVERRSQKKANAP